MRSDLEKFYDQASNQVDINSQDFANVMAYLRSHGMLDPMVMEEEVGTPLGARFRNIYLIYTDPQRPPLRMLAYLVMNRPQGAVVDYQMWAGLKVAIPEEYAPPVKPVVISNPVPKVLVGGLMFGNAYYPVAGDDSPNGQKYTDGRGTFTKVKTPSPFGFSVYWTKDN